MKIRTPKTKTDPETVFDTATGIVYRFYWSPETMVTIAPYTLGNYPLSPLSYVGPQAVAFWAALIRDVADAVPQPDAYLAQDNPLPRCA